MDEEGIFYWIPYHMMNEAPFYFLLILLVAVKARVHLDAYVHVFTLTFT